MSGQGGDGSVTLQLVFRLLQQIQNELRSDQRERRDLRSLVLDQVEQGRRLDRHLLELSDDLALMIKSELMGRLGNLEIQIDHRFTELSERLEEMERPAAAGDEEALRSRLRGSFGLQ